MEVTEILRNSYHVESMEVNQGTPPNLINIQGHELEGAFIVHT